MGLFSSKKSSTTNQSTVNNAYDQRQVNDASGGGVIGTGNDSSTNFLVNDSRKITDARAWTSTSTSTDSRDQSIAISDSRQTTDARAWTDNSRVSYTGTDAAAINAQNSALMKSLGGFQVNAIDRAAELGSDLFSLGSQNAATAWNRTLDTSERLITGLLETTNKTTAQAGTVANAAISSFQPGENKVSETVQRLGFALAAALALAFIFKKG